LHIEVPAVKYRALSNKETGESSSTIKERVNEARKRQRNRLGGNEIFCNARMTEKQIKTYCSIDEESHRLLEMAIDKLGLSARALNRILKVSRTIADLETKESIESAHIAEAIQYRSLDRNLI
jgi:magnesium chelatase family protein